VEKNGSQNHIVTAGKGSNMQGKRCWKTKEFAGPGGFFWKNSAQFNCTG